MKTKILALLTEGPLSTKELSLSLGAEKSAEFKALVKTLAFLEETKQIEMTHVGTFRLKNKEMKTYVTGTYRGNERGFGFVMTENQDQEVYIPKGLQANAMSGDKVEVLIQKEGSLLQDKTAEGTVTRILEHVTQTLVGEFFPYASNVTEKTGWIGYVIPQKREFAHMTCFIKEMGLKPVEGTICLVTIEQYPSPENPKSLTGMITKEIGHKDAPGVDILSILHQHNIPTEFPDQVLEAANQFGLEVSERDLEDRVDLRSELIFTIDGADAKDLDDAISLRVLANGHYELGVHIADVSHYVEEAGLLDQEAYERATSVYLTDRVVPMLPQRLSNGICSLHPEVDRLTMSCVMTIDSQGQVIAHKIFPSVISSKKRMVYDRVNQAIVDQNKKAREEHEGFIETLTQMAELHHILHANRRKRGAIDFETKEAKILVDRQGRPLDILLRERGLAERMIESFMLAANETVAKHYMDLKYPFIYRIHEQPNPEKMQRFMEFVTSFGIMMKGSSENVQPKTLQKVLQEVQEQPYEAVVSTTLLRSMQQAKYDYHPLGHFGLATGYYTHFTSPIRRYPDLIVHRFIKKYAQEKPRKSDFNQLESLLDDIAQQSSQMERRAVEAERETVALKKAEFMLDKVSQQFSGLISSVTRFGIFVELPNSVEGLVHVSRMSDDHYEFIENHLLLIGKRTGNTYQIGQKVDIIVSRVDIESRTIDFELVYPKGLKQNKEQTKREAKAKKAIKTTRQKKEKGRKQTKKFVKKKR